MTKLKTTTDDAPDCVGFAVRQRVRDEKQKGKYRYRTISRVYAAKSAALDFLKLVTEQGEVDIRDAWVCAMGDEKITG